MAAKNEKMNNSVVTGAGGTGTGTNNGESNKDEDNFDEQVNLKEELKNILKVWTEDFVGLMNIAYTEYWSIRIMWIVVFSALFGYGLYTIVVFIMQYLQYATTIQIRVGTETPVQFPAVTICNLNPFYINDVNETIYVQNVLINNNMAYAVNASSGNNLMSSSSSNDTTDVLDNILEVLQRSITTNLSLTDADRKKFGFQLDNYMLLSCKFNGIDCNEKNFSWFWSYDYGNCYTFNSGKNSLNQTLDVWNVSKSGANYGLKLELFVSDPDLQAYSYKTGAFLIVHNKSTNVKARGLLSGINIRTGYDTYVAVRRQFKNKLAAPYSNCIDTWTPPSDNDYATLLYNYVKSSNMSEAYDRQICYEVCKQDQIYKNCSCMSPDLPMLLSNMSFCQNSTQNECIDRIAKTMSTSNINAYCKNACPLQCSSVLYSVDSYSSTYPSSYYVNLLNSSTNFLKVFPLNDSTKASKVRECILKVSVNYNELAYEIVADNPQASIDDFLGVLGGQVIYNYDQLDAVQTNILELNYDLKFLYIYLVGCIFHIRHDKCN